MRCVLIQQRVHKAIDDSFAAEDSPTYKEECSNLVISSITLHLYDVVNRKLGSFKTAKDLCGTLDKTYTDKSLPEKCSWLKSFSNINLI